MFHRNYIIGVLTSFLGFYLIFLYLKYTKRKNESEIDILIATLKVILYLYISIVSWTLDENGQIVGFFSPKLAPLNICVGGAAFIEAVSGFNSIFKKYYDTNNDKVKLVAILCILLTVLTSFGFIIKYLGYFEESMYIIFIPQALIAFLYMHRSYKVEKAKQYNAIQK